MVLTFEFLNEIQKGVYSNDSLLTVLSCGPIYYAIQGSWFSLDEILKCDRADESNRAVFSCAAVYFTVQSGSNF